MSAIRRVVPSRLELTIFVASSVLYLALPSHNANYADDWMSWAQRISAGTGIINGHHLYLNAMRWLYGALGGAIEPARLLAIYSSLSGGLALAALYRLCRRAGLGHVALATTMFCAFTAGFWAYAIVGDVYVPAIAWTLVGLNAFFSGLEAPTARDRWLAAAGAMIAFTLMLMHHQAHFALLPGLAAGAILMRGAGALRRLVYATAIVAVVAGLALAIYGAAYLSKPPEARHGFRAFMSGYASSFDARPDQKKFTPSTFAAAAVGEARALFATSIIYRSRWITQKVQTKYPYRNIYPYPYLVKRLSGVSVGLVLLGLALAAITAGPLALAGLMRALRERGPLFVILLAAIPQALLFVWWEAISDEFWLWTLPFVAIVVAAGVPRGDLFRASALRLAVVGLLVSSLLGAVLPFHDASRDIDMVNKRYVTDLHAGDLLIGWDQIQSTNWIVMLQRKQGFRYENIQLAILRWTPEDSVRVENEITAALSAGANVVVDPYLVHPPRSTVELARLENPAVERERAGIVARLQGLDPGRTVWPPLVAQVPGYFE